jgi:hypothetical protein
LIYRLQYILRFHAILHSCHPVVLVHRTQSNVILLAQPEGLDAEADAEADRIIAEITSGVLSNAGAAPAAAVPGKHAAAEEAAPEAQVLASVALHGVVLLSRC